MILNFKVSESSQDEPKVKSSWKKTRNEERHAKWLAKSTTNSNSTPVAAAKVIPLENQIPKVSVEKKVSVIPAATSAVSATASEPKKIASVSPVKKQEIITDTTTKAISKPVIPILVSINKSSSIFTSNPEIPVIKETLKPKKITSETVFSKLETFQEMNLNPLIVKHLSAKLNIKKPTKIQRVAVPALLDNISNDFLIKAQTGI